jgi:hypothetical protein
MEHEARLKQDDIQVAHEERSLEVAEPLYGLAPEPGEGGPESVNDPNQPSVEAPVEEPESEYDDRVNMTWGIILGGVIVLAIIVAVLYLGVGNTYSSQPFTTYPVK